MRLATRFTTDATPALEWEECACLACGGDQLTPVVEAADTGTGLRFLIVKCDGCDLAFTNPRPSPLSMRRFYPDDYHCHQAKLPTFKSDPLARYLPIKGQARLLDFGCGTGNFLMRMHATGWNVVGLDVSASAVANVRARGMIAHLGTLPHADFADSCFEAITMRQSLEHVHRPLDVLRAARSLLADDGRLVIAVPNFGSLASRWFGADWFGLDLPRHLTHFTPLTLRAILQRAGFERIEMHQEMRTGWIRHSAKLAAERQRCGMWIRLLKSHVGSTIAGRWGRAIGAADCLIAVASNG